MDCSNLFAPVTGQIQAITLLQNAITKNRIAPAYLFAGPAGVGRALTARLFAGTLLAQGLSPEQSDLAIRRAAAGNHPDLWWVEPTFLHQGKRLTLTEAITAGLKRKAPPQIRIEQIREIGQFLSKPPLEARQAMVIIESAETMPEAAANALLKTLEEPGQATIILIAPAAESLLPTLVSRCQKIPFHRLNSGDLETVLRRLGQADILEHAVLMATGSPGEAITAYEKQQTIPSDIFQSLTTVSKPLAALKHAKVIAELDADAQLWLLEYLQYYSWQTHRQVAILQEIETARRALRFYVQPRLVWECVLLKLQTVNRQLF